MGRRTMLPWRRNSCPIQRKLTIGRPGDRYEQEADRVANQVVTSRSHAPEVQRQDISDVQRVTLSTPAEDEKLSTAEARMEKDKVIQEKPDLQRMHAPEEEPVQAQKAEEEEAVQSQEEEEAVQAQEEEEAVQAQEEEEAVQAQEEEEAVQAQEEEEPIQAKACRGKPASATQKKAKPSLRGRLKNSIGKGKPLPEKLRAEMEAGFGVDFRKVKIHTDAESDQMNKALGAQAFAHGTDIYFKSGKFRPETNGGKVLLAHELTHVVQQGGGKTKREQQ